MKMNSKNKLVKRLRRIKRTRSKIKGSAEIPRLSVFRSLNYIYAQLIDDAKGETLVSAAQSEIKKFAEKGKIFRAAEVGKLLAEKAVKKGIKKAVFDRGAYKYHGRVKALAEGAREGGLKF